MRFKAICLLLFFALPACGERYISIDSPDGGGMGGSETDALAVDRFVCGDSPWVRLGGVPNARSLGGVPLADGASVACGMLFRGAPLTALMVSGCEDFTALGIKTVVDLRVLSERTSPPACVLAQATLVTAPMPIPYNVSPTDYLADLYATDAIVPAMAVLGDPASYPVYFHCTYGRDRSGVLAAVVLLALGAAPEEIRREYLLTQAAGYGAYPESLDAVLAEVARIGGIDAYFERMGIPAAQVARMRALLITPAEETSSDAAP